MAKRDQFTLTLAERRRRSFSDTFKRDKVREIDLGLVSVSEISRQYSVSKTSIYAWLHKFATNKETPEKLIVETMSDTRALLEMKERVAELERMIGQKQIEIDFYKKMIDLAQEHYGIEIKKTILPNLAILLVQTRRISLQYEPVIQCNGHQQAKLSSIPQPPIFKTGGRGIPGKDDRNHSPGSSYDGLQGYVF